MSGPLRPPLRVRDSDSSPNVIPVNTIVVSDGDLVDDGGATVTIDTTGAGATPAGSDTEIQFNDAGAFGASSQFTYTKGASLGRLGMTTGSSAIQAEIRALDGHGLQIGSSDVTASALRSVISMYGENDAPDGLSIISKATGGTVWIKTTGTGATEIGNETTNQDTTLQVAGNGTGKPIINLKNDTMAASLEVTTNEELSIKGGTDLFKFDVSSATGAMTFPDGTTQNTAATGGVTFPLEGDDDSAAAPNYSWSSATNSGLFRLTGTTIGIAVAGSAAMYFQSTKIEANKRFEVLAGTAAAPSLMFGGDNDTGLYSLAANKIGLTTGGVVRLGIGDAGDILVGGTAAGTDGQVLTSGGAGAAVAWEDAGGGGATLDEMMGAKTLTGSNTRYETAAAAPYGSGANGTTNTGVIWQDDCFLYPFIAVVSGQLTEFGTQFGSASSGGINYAVYDSDGTTQMPNTLLAQATLTYSASAGVYQTSLTAPTGTGVVGSLVAGGLYWCCYTRQTAGTDTKMSAVTNATRSRISPIALVGNTNGMILSTSDYDAGTTFPDTFSTTNLVPENNYLPRFSYKVT